MEYFVVIGEKRNIIKIKSTDNIQKTRQRNIQASNESSLAVDDIK